MEQNKKMFFAVDTNTVKMKKLLNKEFLELQMQAISSANPNVNNSWFTPESMKKALPTFKNKPILGYFGNGDFESHNGVWRKDAETKIDYWDTLGEKGERILGVIRENDDVSITEKEDGLTWITLTCVLWVSYCFKQVQRLIKDAIRAQKSGGATKNISVEVDITDYEELENGVIKINDFKLVGITILGSRNGVPVKPGIENAELSLVEMLDNEKFESQQKALRLAYEKLEGSDLENKEEKIRMDNEQTSTQVEQASAPVVEPVVEPTVEPTPAEPHFEQTPAPEATPAAEPVNTEIHQNEEATPAAEPQPAEVTPQEPIRQNECCCEDPAPADPIYDLTWLVSDCHWNSERYDRVIKHYEEQTEEIPHKDSIISLLKRMKKNELAAQKDLADLLAKVTANELSDADDEKESKMASFEDYNAMYDHIVETDAKLAEADAKLVEANEKVAKFEKDKFLDEVKATLGGYNIDEAYRNEVYEKCEKGEFDSIDAITKEVALHIGMASLKKPAEVAPVADPAPAAEPVAESFEAAVPTAPVVESTVEEKPKTRWERIKAYGKAE